MTTVKHPGFLRRAFTHVLDRSIYVGLDALLAIMSGDPGRFWLLHNDDWIAVTLLLASLALLLLDQLVFMAVYGVTFSKWMMGYRLRRKDGRPPGFIRAFFWNIIVEPLELITLGVVSLILTLKRDDKATLHDLVLGTRAVLVKGEGKRKRVIISAAVIVVLFCAFMNIMAYSLYMIFVNPTRTVLVDEGRIVRPGIGSLEGRRYIKPFTFKGLVLFDSIDMGKIDICLKRKGERAEIYSEDAYVMSEGTKRLFVYYKKYEGFTISLSPKFRFASFLWSIYPFKEYPVEMAKDVVVGGDPEFSLWSPARNFARLYAQLIWAIMTPYDSNAVEAYQSPDSLVAIYAITALDVPPLPEGAILGVNIRVVSNEGIETYSVRDPDAYIDENGEVWKEYIGRILSGFSPLPHDSERVEDYRDCSPVEGSSRLNAE